VSDEKPVAGVIPVVIVVMLVTLVIQCCMYTPEIDSNELILETGRIRFIEQLPMGKGVEILDEQILRPGRNGGEYGYWLKYKTMDADGNMVEKEYYDE